MKSAWDDDLLFEGIQNGNSQAIKHFFHVYYPCLCRLSIRITGNKEESEDIAIQAIYVTLERKNTFRNMEQMRMSMFKLARDKSFKYIKARKLDAALRCEIQSHNFNEDISNDIFEISIYKKILEEIESLPKTDQKILKLYYLEGLKTNDIARLLNRRDQSIHNIRRQLLKKIRNTLIRKKLIPDERF